jgi:hypothetical protein
MFCEVGLCRWNRVDTVLIPYGPGSNPTVCDCSINYHPFGSFSPGSNPDRNYKCHAVYDKGGCSFGLGIEAGRCISNRFSTDIDTELKSLQKILNMTQKFFSPYRSHEIGTGCDAGPRGLNRLNTVFISYGPGSKYGCVRL